MDLKWIKIKIIKLFDKPPMKCKTIHKHIFKNQFCTNETFVLKFMYLSLTDRFAICCYI